jgi:hypothetical protein
MLNVHSSAPSGNGALSKERVGELHHNPDFFARRLTWLLPSVRLTGESNLLAPSARNGFGLAVKSFNRFGKMREVRVLHSKETLMPPRKTAFNL